MARVNLASVAVVLLLLGQLPTCSAQGTIVEIASGNEELSTLVAAIEAAGLTETLSGPGPFTVFAPTNSAFAAALSSLGLTAQQLLGNEDLAEDVKYHAIGGAQVMAGDLMNSQVVDTVAELPLGLVVADSGDIKLIHGLQTKATVIDADIVASNGVIHIIDTVLIRPQQTIPELMRDEIPDLSALEQELVQLGLNQTLSGEGPFTVFAPINTAFASLSGELPASVSDIMLYHVSSGISLSGALNSGMLIESLNPNAYSVGVSIDDSQSEPRTVNLIHGGSAMTTVVFADVMATNGIIHLIDAVLLPPSMNIPELAFAIGLTALVSAVNNAGLAETLSGEGPFTVFAPTEGAFEGVELPAGPSEILLYHVLNGTVLSGGLENGMMVPTLNAYPIGVSVSDAGVSIIHGDSPAAMVTTANVMATNGIVHLVNTVLTPPTRNIPELAFANGLTTLMSAVTNAGLAETLSGEGPFTVFAPTEDAFEGVELPGDPSEVLLYHVLNGIALSSSLENNMFPVTRAKQRLGVAIDSAGEVTLAHASSPMAVVTAVDIMATNGIVHVIDAVLMPPTMTIAEMVEDSDALSTLLAAVQAADLVDTPIPIPIPIPRACSPCLPQSMTVPPARLPSWESTQQPCWRLISCPRSWPTTRFQPWH